MSAFDSLLPTANDFDDPQHKAVQARAKRRHEQEVRLAKVCQDVVHKMIEFSKKDGWINLEWETKDANGSVKVHRYDADVVYDFIASMLAKGFRVESSATFLRIFRDENKTPPLMKRPFDDKGSPPPPYHEDDAMPVHIAEEPLGVISADQKAANNPEELENPEESRASEFPPATTFCDEYGWRWLVYNGNRLQKGSVEVRTLAEEREIERWKTIIGKKECGASCFAVAGGVARLCVNKFNALESKEPSTRFVYMGMGDQVPYCDERLTPVWVLYLDSDSPRPFHGATHSASMCMVYSPPQTKDHYLFLVKYLHNKDVILPTGCARPQDVQGKYVDYSAIAYRSLKTFERPGFRSVFSWIRDAKLQTVCTSATSCFGIVDVPDHHRVYVNHIQEDWFVFDDIIALPQHTRTSVAKPLEYEIMLPLPQPPLQREFDFGAFSRWWQLTTQYRPAVSALALLNAYCLLSGCVFMDVSREKQGIYFAYVGVRPSMNTIRLQDLTLKDYGERFMNFHTMPPCTGAPLCRLLFFQEPEAAKLHLMQDAEARWVSELDDDGNTPLHYACTFAQWWFVEQNGAHARMLYKVKNRFGMAPVHMALFSGHTKSIMQSLVHSANVGLETDWGTLGPLDVALMLGLQTVRDLFPIPADRRFSQLPRDQYRALCALPNCDAFLRSHLKFYGILH
jgi:hypothetical protein